VNAGTRVLITKYDFGTCGEVKIPGVVLGSAHHHGQVVVEVEGALLHIRPSELEEDES
jgi:hypothetical protein